MSLEEYFGDWLKVINKQELTKVMSIISAEYKRKPLCPAQQDVFKAFRLCPLKDLRIIMLLQDPYPQKDVATGIALGNKLDTINLSPSLNIIKEAALDFEVPKYGCNFDPTLESWAKQGILLLNSALTVEMNKPCSHTMIWRPFIIAFLKSLSEYEAGLIYVLFGKQAQTFSPYINKVCNDVIEIEHPAYFARTNKRMPTELFRTISKKCKDKNGTAIKWYEDY